MGVYHWDGATDGYYKCHQTVSFGHGGQARRQWQEGGDLNPSAYASGLRRGDDGLWHSSASEEISYPPDASDLYYSIEDRSFWFRHRNACIRELLGALPPPGAIFDLGGGNGFVSAMLQRSGYEAVLVEPSLEACRNGAARGVFWIIHSSAQSAGFHPRSLPAAGLFDVLEHIEDDAGFLVWLASRMAPGGRLYLTVPAHRVLWSDEDERAGHFRRYSRADVLGKLVSAKLTVLYHTSIFRPLSLAIFLLRAVPSRLRGRGEPSSATVGRLHGTSGGIATAWLKPLLRADLRAIKRGRSLRGGSSLLLVAEKGRD